MDHQELAKLFQTKPKDFFKYTHDSVVQAVESAPLEYQGRLWAIQETWDRKMANVKEEDRLKTAKETFVEMVQGVLCPEWR